MTTSLLILLQKFRADVVIRPYKNLHIFDHCKFLLNDFVYALVVKE